jgi:hypothetical protein
MVEIGRVARPRMRGWDMKFQFDPIFHGQLPRDLDA